ncbi:MAG TPA: GNAT family protein [Kofleriaceae bacterium]|nr:GNAT family protein [Kofleriaceae bacterium]
MTDRTVRLRALSTNDLETLRAFVNDEEVLRLSNVYKPISDAQQESWWRAVNSDPHAVWFGIEIVSDHRLIGTCCLVDIELISRQAELRIRIGSPATWGRSLGSEACSALVEYGFHQLGLNRIWLRVAANHDRAIRLYEKLGFKAEGRLRDAMYLQGAHVDVVLMALLRAEWHPA